MSGFYNYHPTISEPGKFTIQTASQQPPFYFGGSQVPVNLGIEKTNNESIGNGLKSLSRGTKRKYINIK